MRIRLHVESQDGRTNFVHAGPTIHLGRDPSCELAVEGTGSDAVSRRHARIDLSPDGAILTDLGSSNKTLLNGTPITEAKSIQKGDRIGLGATGATLTVLELDLSAPLPASSAPSQPLPRGVVLGGAVGGLVLLGILGVALWPKGPTQVVEAPPETSPRAEERTTARKAEPLVKAPPPVTRPPEPVIAVSKDDPSDAIQEVGRHVRPNESTSSLLLQRQSENYPWVPLRQGDKVHTTHTLVSLPGFRSAVALDNGVQLTLCGNIPNFWPEYPVAESVVVLGAPTGSDLAADVTLERGSLHLAVEKGKTPVRVRLRFGRALWDLTLKGDESEVMADLWWPPPLWVDGKTQAQMSLTLWTRGQVQIRTSPTGQARDLSRLTSIAWSPSQPNPEPSAIAALPDHWDKPLDLKKPKVMTGLLTLLSWREAFESLGSVGKGVKPSGDVLDLVLTRIRNSSDIEERILGILFAAALDATGYLPDLLSDRSHPWLRHTAAHSLRQVLARGGERAAGDLSSLFQSRLAFTREKANLAVRLLHVLPQEVAARKETHRDFLAHLDHEDLAIRDLAFWHLFHLDPEGWKASGYQPTDEMPVRRKALDLWRK